MAWYFRLIKKLPDGSIFDNTYSHPTKNGARRLRSQAVRQQGIIHVSHILPAQYEREVAQSIDSVAHIYSFRPKGGAKACQ